MQTIIGTFSTTMSERSHYLLQKYVAMVVKTSPSSQRIYLMSLIRSFQKLNGKV